MVALRLKVIFLLACFAEVTLLLIAQVLGSTPLIYLCLLSFLALAVWAVFKRISIPVFLFFLPFSALLKTQPGTTSFYTIALFLVYMIYMVMGCKNVRIHHVIPGLCLLALTLVSKTAYGHGFDNAYLLFCAAILLLPFVTQELDGAYDFYWLTCFFSLGIILAALTSRQLTAFSTIARYIEIKDLFGVQRYSGYYADPNFYSAHITTALGGVLVLLLNRVDIRKAFVLTAFLVLLIYCGSLSVSKSFLLVAVCLLLFWAVSVLFQKDRMSAKLMILLSFSVGVLFLLSSTLFTDMIDTMLTRFGSDKSLSDFTTGRTELWMQYVRAFEEDPFLLFFGNGYTDVTVNGRASHNTLIQIIFQFGLVGGLVLLAWFACYVRTLLDDTRIRWDTLTQLFILFVGAFGPWMALDLVFFDEFFLIPVFVCVAVRFVTAEAMRQTE